MRLVAIKEHFKRYGKVYFLFNVLFTVHVLIYSYNLVVDQIRNIVDGENTLINMSIIGVVVLLIFARIVAMFMLVMRREYDRKKNMKKWIAVVGYGLSLLYIFVTDIFLVYSSILITVVIFLVTSDKKSIGAFDLGIYITSASLITLVFYILIYLGMYFYFERKHKASFSLTELKWFKEVFENIALPAAIFAISSSIYDLFKDKKFTEEEINWYVFFYIGTITLYILKNVYSAVILLKEKVVK